MKKRVLSLLLSLTFLLTSFTIVPFAEEDIIRATLYSENFERYNVGDKPDMEVYDSLGKIYVDTIGASKVLHIENVNGLSLSTVEKRIERIEEKTVCVSVSFMQTQSGSSGNTVLQLFDGENKLTILAQNGAFYFNDIKLSDYVSNKWYKLTLVVNLQTSKFEIFINSSKVLENENTELTAISGIGFVAKESPGFYIDNILVDTEQVFSEISIDGVSSAVIPRNGDNTYTFSACIKDSSELAIPISDVSWTWEPRNYPNVEITEKDNKLIVNVSSQAQSGTLIVTASVLGGKYTKSKEITVESVSAEELEIIGEPRIAGSSKADYVYNYDVVMKDQNGDILNDFGEFVWSIWGLNGYEIPDSITVNSSNGDITVTSETPYREFIKLKATSVENNAVWAEKKILVTDLQSYVLDNYRYNAAKSHVDNALKYAKDPFDDSPLISDFIYVPALEPGSLPLKNGEKLISHNIGTMSSFLRSMINLSNFENDDSYRQRVYDIYKYNMDIATEPTYLYEGGHMEVDLSIKRPNDYRMTDNLYIQETKGGTIYRSPMFEVDYDRAALLAKCCFVGHAGFYDTAARWNHLQISRHWGVKTQALTPTSVEQWWNDTSLYDKNRKGAVIGVSECQFLVGYSEMFTLFAEYFKAARTPEEKEQILKWGELLYSSLDQTGYDPLTGKYTGMFNETNGSQHSWTKIYNVWEVYGRHWYDEGKVVSAGDRLFSNVILGDRDLRPVSEGGEGFGPSSDGKSWVNTHYDSDPYKGVNEENWMHFLEPYMFTRENSCITSMGGLFDFIDVLDDNSELKTSIIEKYTNSIYNYLNLRYDSQNSQFKAMMSWGLDVTGWEYPHAGYYRNMGSSIFNSKMPEVELLVPLARLSREAITLAENTEEDIAATNTYPENKRKAQLEEQAEYIWSVLRSICKKSYQIGDIGDPFNNIPPELDFATTAYSTALVEGMMCLYQIYEHEDFLKMAQVIANNIASSRFSEAAGIFMSNDTLLAATGAIEVQTFLKLEALLLDDFDNLIEANSYGSQIQYWDPTYVVENGTEGDKLPFAYLTVLTEPEVQQTALIIEEPFTMNVGESRKIEVTVLPYDAGTGVLWDVSNPEIADISTDGVIKAKRTGTVEIRCVSSSVKSLSSDTITITVE
ncbi:MAG: Ig-like domain-containing protein [Clostridia bacterium]|nr:Ig-like domain-containing protein [Clostridia bacterium]